MKIKDVPIDELNPSEYNPRALTEKEYEDLKESLKRFDFVEPIVVNYAENRKNIVIGGHQRLIVAKQMGYKTIPVSYVKITKLKKEQELNLRLNKNLGHFDYDLLANFDEELLLDVGFTEEELDDKFNLDEVKGKEDDFDVDKALKEISEPICKRGDLYQLGEHRLMCGDSKKREDIERLMDGKKADMVFTDPPYGIDYQDLKKRFNKIINDKESDIPKILKSIIRWENIPYYICCNWQSYPLFFMILKDLIDIKALIVWDKKRGVQNLDKYYKRHEFIIYSGAFGREKTIDGDVWELNREISELHPTMKPIELCSKAINNSSKKGMIVLDSFGGSGSTLIACEQLERICYMMEIDQVYCDVIIKRWEDYTDKKAVKVN